MPKKKSEKGEEPVRIDVGIGLGEVFRGIGDLFQVINNMIEKGHTEAVKTKELRGLAGIKGSKAIVGYSVKIGAGGLPVVEPFGNIFGGKEGVIVEEKREPLVDVFDEEDKVRVIAELPGVEEKDIKTKLKGNRLTISAGTPDRSYHKELSIPVPVKASSLRSKYKNGVLELTIDKRKEIK